MNIEKAKTMVNTILDLNETDEKFTYAPGTSFISSGIIISCMVHNRRTGEVKYLQDFKGDIFHRIDDARDALIANEKKFIEQRKAELEKELEKLSG